MLPAACHTFEVMKMNRLDRALGILLVLRGGKTFSAPELSRRFEVSIRTIYRDIETLCAVGVPIYAEMGRAGGFRLVEGYFLPPVMFSVGEAVSLLLGLALLRSLHARPFAAEIETADQKLLAAVPDQLRAVLAKTQQIIGFESMPADIFHPERSDPHRSTGASDAESREGLVISVFLQAVFDRNTVTLDYRSPYGARTEPLIVTPCGLLWDRDRWYLAGKQAERADDVRLWRADRVRAIEPYTPATGVDPTFDVGALLGHTWLRSAMARWRRASPVVIRLSEQQAERLKQDWYYRHAGFEDLPGDQVLMTFGEDDREVVLSLLRWLGPGAELVAPEAWRALARAELAEMLAVYADDVIHPAPGRS
jgi:predicted DNA-binding transcriptional regulator YafY